MGFAGGFTLGMVQSGFKLTGKRELKGGFGVPNCEANRHLLGNEWETEIGTSASWTEPRGGVEVVFGNPPCSGFSLMTDKRHRGPNAKINHCMWEFAAYAARCRPQIAVFESVRQAYNQGHELMTALRAHLEEHSGLRYDLYHVMHNAYDLGGAAVRPRYFWVASQVPFAIDHAIVPEDERPVLRDVIGDLVDMPVTWRKTRYNRPGTWWTDVENVRSPLGEVDGHMNRGGLATDRALDLLALVEEKLDGWPPNWHIGKMAKYAWEHLGELPDSWSHMIEKLIRIDFHMGFTSLTRWDMERPGRVVTGGALSLVLHPSQPRTITHREAARIMGFPDDWLIEPMSTHSGLQHTWGKGITVQCGRWIGAQVMRALNGDVGDELDRGTPVGDREWLIDPKGVKRSSGSRTSYKVTTPAQSAEMMTEVDTMSQYSPAWKGRTLTTPNPTHDVPAAPSVPSEATPQDTTPNSGKRGRGRPRPDETVERDNVIMRSLEEAGTDGLSRDALVEKLGGDIKPGLVYLSLYRLRKDGRVRSGRANGKHMWYTTA